jgi:hypothetical protein
MVGLLQRREGSHEPGHRTRRPIGGIAYTGGPAERATSNAGQTDDVLSKSAQLGQELCLLLCKLDYRRSEKRYCAKKLSIAFSLILQLHHQIGCLFGTPLSVNILAIGHLELPVRGSANIAPAPHPAIDRFQGQRLIVVRLAVLALSSQCLFTLHLPTGPSLGPPPWWHAVMRVNADL